MIGFATQARSYLLQLSRPNIVFWVLPLLMIVLVMGTIAQKWIGLYAAQNTYFGSIFFWLGPIPFPGGLTLTTLFAVNLTCKFLFKSTWSWRQAGSVITHLGVLVLLIGGLLTALTQREGYIVIPEGETRHEAEDYHQRELVIRSAQGSATSPLPLKNIAFEDLTAGLSLTDPAIPFTMTILTTCSNCGIQKRDPTTQDNWTSPGKFMQLIPKDPDPQDEKNMTGIEFAIKGTPTSDGNYLTFDKFPKPPVITAQAHNYTITIERARRPLPFAVRLNKFTRDLHKGSDMERDFLSDISIITPQQSWDARIAMNEPVRLKGYTIYQSSFDLSGEKPQTILSVVENKGQVFPYIASIIMALGLILQLIMRMKMRKNAAVMLILSSLLMGGSPHLAHAAPPTFSTDSFASLPVFHEGRLKPIGSFAAIELKKLSGKSALKDQSASAWLVTVLFDPVNASATPVFSIDNPTTRHALGLTETPSNLYSFEDLTAGLNTTAPALGELLTRPPSELTPDDKDMLRIHNNAAEFVKLLRSLSLLLPLNIEIPKDFQNHTALSGDGVLNYLYVRGIEPDLQEKVKKIIARKGDNPENYTDNERDLALLSWQLSTIAEGAQNNDLFKVIPLEWHTDHGSFVTPWDIINKGAGNPQTQTILKEWQNLAFAYQTQNPARWDAALASLSRHIHETALSAHEKTRLSAEITFNHIKPFDLALAGFALTLVMGLIAMALPQKLWVYVGWIAGISAIMLQGTGLAWRIIVLERPPVGTLYESLLFVGLIAPLIGIILERRFKNGAGIILAGLSGAGLGIMAMTMMGEDDSLKMLSAVLNTRFWLMTHVLCITIGYGWCLITAALAHGLLWVHGTRNLTPHTHNNHLHTLTMLTLTSLLFTTIGTILGGIWADQSWGRFWGWDPKENGALLIVLWLAWVMHGRISGQLSHPLYLAGLSFLGVIVGAAWIGVNLLGVGLHSYGFTEGVFWGLGLFTLAEIVIIAALVYRCKRTSHAA